MSIQTLSEETFDNAIQQPDRPTVIYVWATWCHPCKSQTPQFEAAAQTGNAHFYKLNADENSGLLRRLRVLGVPSLLYFRAGKMVASHTGVQSASQIAAQLTDIAARPADELSAKSPLIEMLRGLSMPERIMLAVGVLLAVAGIIFRLS